MGNAICRFQFELKELKRRQEAAEEAERQRLQAEQDARAAAEAQAEAARLAEAKDAHDAPGSPQREQGKIHTIFVTRIDIQLPVRYLPPTCLPTSIFVSILCIVLDTCKNSVIRYVYL